jgi:hypothetical protein
MAKKFEFGVFTAHTNGKGMWSRSVKEVKCTGIDILVSDANEKNSEPRYAEMRVYFDTSTWDVTKDNFIYTDPQFLSLLRSHLDLYHINGENVDYSEQGMQGDDYVSLDVSGSATIGAIKETIRKFNR